MSKSIKVAIFQAPYASMDDCGVWEKTHSDAKETIPAEYYILVFCGEIELPDSIPDIDDNRNELILEYVFQKFNIDHPRGYCGRSLSAGDVVKLEGKTYLCKSIGFQECDFTSNRPASRPECDLELYQQIKQVLIKNKIKVEDASPALLQAVGYALLKEGLYQESKPIEKPPVRSPEQIRKAEQILIDNGIEDDEAETVLQAIGYVLLDEELYPGD